MRSIYIFERNHKYLLSLAVSDWASLATSNAINYMMQQTILWLSNLLLLPGFVFYGQFLSNFKAIHS